MTFTKKYNSSVVLPEAEGLEKNGSSFGGWKSSDGNIFRPGDKVTMAVNDMVFAAIWSKLAIPVADEKVEVDHSSVGFSKSDVESDKEYIFGLNDGIIAKFKGGDVTGDVTFTAELWNDDFHVEGAVVYTIDMVGSGSVNILIPVGEFGRPIVHHIGADGDVELDSTIVIIDGIKYASFDADNFSFFYMVESTDADVTDENGGGTSIPSGMIAAIVVAAIAVILVAVWAHRRKSAL